MTKDEKTPIGVLGLGIMGGAIARALLDAGHPVNGYDPAEGAMAQLAAHGGEGCSDAGAVALESRFIIASLPSSDSLMQAARLMAASALHDDVRRVVVETSTLPLAAKQAAADVLKEAGFDILDCPISGTGATLKDRSWTIYCSGDTNTYWQVHPILKVLADKIPHVGEFGSGTKMKIAANHLVAIYNVAYAESVNLVRKLGLDAHQFLELVGHGSFLGTGVMRLRMPFMIDRSYLPATMKLDLWQKDMSVIGGMARAVNCPVPLLSACAPIYDAGMAQGFGHQDTASVSEVIAGMAGLDSAGAAWAGSGKRAELPAPNAQPNQDIRTK